MQLFSQAAARQFSLTFAKPAAAPVEDIDVLLHRVRKRPLREGTPEYQAYRDNILREAERSYYAAVACFRRAHDIMVASSASWVHVTLYYANWYAAKSIIALFGCWLDGKTIIDVRQETPHHEFDVMKNPSNWQGSHRAFWIEYYKAVTSLRYSVGAPLITAVEAVQQNPIWQIDTRNRFNYRVSEARTLATAFKAQFNATTVPLSLPGDTATQYGITTSAIRVAAKYMLDFQVQTDVFSSRASEIQLEVIDAVLPTPFDAADTHLYAV